MKISQSVKLVFLLLLMGTINAQDIENNAPHTPDIKPPAKLLAAPVVLSPSYGVFKVGYAYQYQNGAQISKNNGIPFEYTQNNNMIYFGIERGWIGGFRQMIMVGGYIDGAFGQTFFLSGGAKLSFFLLDGWIIPHISLGYQVENLEFPKESSPLFMHTGVASIGAHFNITKGFGIDLSLRSGLPFYILRPIDAREYNHPHINHLGVMLSFSFYDFSL